MLSVAVLLWTYVLGGLTLLPLVLATLAAVILYTSPVSKRVTVGEKRRRHEADAHDDEREPTLVYRAGWLTARRTYEPLPSTSDTYMGMLANGYKSWMDSRSRDPRRIKVKEHFYAVLKQRVLYLYDNEDQLESWAAIELGAMDVSLYPVSTLDGEMFVKRVAICIKPKEGECDEFHKPAIDKTHDLRIERRLPWFLFLRVNSDKEDWYHSLVLASKLLQPDRIAQDESLFDKDDMANLISQIDSTSDSIPMRWFNALMGRMFLGVYRTSALEAYLTSRIVRKLKRVKTPNMLSEIQVREVNVGAAAPMFSKPMLKDLTPEGDAILEMHVAYRGGASITFSTTATINLGSRFKPYTVRLVLAVILKELEGSLQVKIKKPPSSRIWFGFTKMPRMVLSVEPVVSTRQIKWSLITSPIESRIREVVLESIVLPHMDDAPFFNTAPYDHRGGIWSDALRTPPDLSTDPLPSQATNNGIPIDTIAEKKDETPDDTPIPTDDEVVASTTATDGSNQARPRQRRSSEGDQSSIKPVASSAASVASFGSSKEKDTQRKGTSWLRRSDSQSSMPLSTEGAKAGEDMNKLREMLQSRALERQKEKAASDETTKTTDLPLDLSESTDEASDSKTDIPPSASAPDLSNTADDASTDDKAAPPNLPARPSFAKGVPPPPPRRTHQPAQSAESYAASTSTSASALFANWRAKANDKQAIAASVAQARESMKRWGANWRAKQAEGGASDEMISDEPKPVPNYYGASTPPRIAEPASSSSSARRTSVSTGSTALSSSPSSTGHFVVPAPVATTKVSKATVGDKSAAQAKAPAYKPAAMMAIPGIREQDRKKRVASDHMSAQDAASLGTSPPKQSRDSMDLAAVTGANGNVPRTSIDEAISASTGKTSLQSLLSKSAPPSSTNAPLATAATVSDVESTAAPTIAETTESKVETDDKSAPPPVPARPALAKEEHVLGDAGSDSATGMTGPTQTEEGPSRVTETEAPRPAWIRDKSIDDSVALSDEATDSKSTTRHANGHVTGGNDRKHDDTNDSEADEAGWGFDP